MIFRLMNKVRKFDKALYKCFVRIETGTRDIRRVLFEIRSLILILNINQRAGGFEHNLNWIRGSIHHFVKL